MRENYRYQLESSSRKHKCPGCHEKRFVRYIDTETNQYLPIRYGRCDREADCAYHLNPYTDGYAKEQLRKQDNPSSFLHYDEGNFNRTTANKTAIHTEPVLIPTEVLMETLREERYTENVFIQNLLHGVSFPFEMSDVERVIALYFLGTVSKGYRAGAVTFPFIDLMGGIRTIQAKIFDENNHTVSTDFLHSIIERHYLQSNEPMPDWLVKYKTNEKKVSCLFGEHLLSLYPNNPVILVEAPKTAVIGTLYYGFPEQEENPVWLAVYNKSSFKIDRIQVLAGRDIITFPDLSKDGNTFREWRNKASEMENLLPGTRFNFSDFLERCSTESEKKSGSDLADFLIRHDWRQFRTNKVVPQTSVISDPIPENQACEKCGKSGGEIKSVEKKSEEEDDTTPSMTVGEIFDRMKRKGYKTMPEGVEINAGIWVANPNPISNPSKDKSFQNGDFDDTG